jgi:hypothetical protein
MRSLLLVMPVQPFFEALSDFRLVLPSIIRVYFAGPLFSTAERRVNAALVERIEGLGLRVFLPQRDGAERDRSPYDQMSREERRQVMFKLDRDEILAADVFLFVLDGRVPDEGASVEFGIAYAHKYLERAEKLLIGLQTDVRAAFPGSKLNPMLRVPLDHLVESEEELFDLLTRLAS